VSGVSKSAPKMERPRPMAFGFLDIFIMDTYIGQADEKSGKTTLTDVFYFVL
jgi:hypothetical protein